MARVGQAAAGDGRGKGWGWRARAARGGRKPKSVVILRSHVVGASGLAVGQHRGTSLPVGVRKGVQVGLKGARIHGNWQSGNGSSCAWTCMRQYHSMATWMVLCWRWIASWESSSWLANCKAGIERVWGRPVLMYLGTKLD